MNASKYAIVFYLLFSSVTAFSNPVGYDNDYCVSNIDNYQKLINSKKDIKDSYIFSLHNQIVSKDRSIFIKQHDSLLDLYYENESNNNDSYEKLTKKFFLVMGAKTQFLLVKSANKNKSVLSSHNIITNSDFTLGSLVVNLPIISAATDYDYSGKFNDINTDKINDFIDLIYNDELKILNRNKKYSLLNPDNYPMYTALDIQNVYNKNEVRGDLKFKNKYFFVTGEVLSIDSSIHDQPAISLKTEQNTSFNNPTVFIGDYKSKLEYIADLEKGQKLQLLCKGGGEMNGTPYLIDCDFTNVLFKQSIKQDIKNHKNRKEEPLNLDYINLLPSVLTIMSILPQKSACFNNDAARCREEISALPLDKIKRSALDFGITQDLVYEYFDNLMQKTSKEFIDENADHLNAERIANYRDKCFKPLILNYFLK